MLSLVKRPCLSVCGKKPWQQPTLFGDFQWTHLANNSIECDLVLVLKASLTRGCQLGFCLTSYLDTLLGFSESFHCNRFSYHPSNVSHFYYLSLHSLLQLNLPFLSLSDPSIPNHLILTLPVKYILFFLPREIQYTTILMPASLEAHEHSSNIL